MHFKWKNLLLQLQLKIQEFFNGQFLIVLEPEEVSAQCRINALMEKLLLNQ